MIIKCDRTVDKFFPAVPMHRAEGDIGLLAVGVP